MIVSGFEAAIENTNSSRMDREVSVMLYCASPQGFKEHQVIAEISSRFNQKSASDLDEHIEAVWNERVTKEPWLFNGAKFRLHAAELSTKPPQHHTGTQSFPSKTAENHAQYRIALHSVGKGEHACPRERHELCVNADIEKSRDCEEGEPQEDARTPGTIVRLQLGLTCYRDFLGTNWSQEAGNLQQRGRLELGDPQALLAQPLGVGAVLLTSDGQVVMLKRSQRVAEAAGLLDIPGGHPEPKAVCQGVSEEGISIELLQGRERAVVAEIFSSVCAEVRDEVNVPLDFLSEPVLMGIALNHTSAGRPSAEFFIRCSLTMEEVKEFYWRGGPEAHESTDIVFLSKSKMLELDVTSRLWSELCPSAKGAVLLYQLVRPD